MTHNEAIDAICGCAATVTVLSYREAIEAYLDLRGMVGDPSKNRTQLHDSNFPPSIYWPDYTENQRRYIREDVAISGGGSRMSEDRKFKFENGRFINRVSGEAIPDDEPVIIFRARDRHALNVLAYYLSLARDDHHQLAIMDRMDEFLQFRRDNHERMKEPGITRHIKLNSEEAP